jgi:pyrroline-5-carboxylate reductase
VSVAAGIKISKIESIIGKKKIVRLMPNAPCMVGEMAAAFTANSALKENEIQLCKLFLRFGKIFQVDESLRIL